MTSDEWLNFFEHPDVFAFCAKIAENPDDLAPKLVFADWLEENCPDERFVNTYRRAISRKGGNWSPYCLLESDGRGESRMLPKAWNSNARFDVLGQFYILLKHDLRSMLRFCWSGMVCDATTSPMLAPELQGIDPLYSLRLEILHEGSRMKDAEFPNIRDLRVSLDLRRRSSGLLQFLGPENFPNLHVLEAKSNHLSEADIQQLFSNGVLSNLEYLNLDSNYGVHRAGYSAIANSGFLKNLVELDLSRNGVLIEQFRDFLDSPNLPKLETLRIAQIYSEENRYVEFWELLATHPSTNRIKSLEVSTEVVSPVGLSEFFGTSYFQNLEHLDIGNRNLTTDALRSFFESPSFPKLKSLNFKGNRIDDESAFLMAKSPKMKQIQKLTFNLSRGITIAGWDALLASEYLSEELKREVETVKYLTRTE